ncbi:hypothetical protein M422DRAFT_171278, partial [Sphaerobolus stellatus SS14]
MSDSSQQVNEKQEEKGRLEDDHFQEGGVKAWCTVLGGWLALFATFGYIYSFGVYQDLYVRAGTSTSSNISWIGSVQLFFFVAMGLPAGALLDKGYFRITVFIGSLIYIFSLFMLSLAHVDKYYQLFLSQGVGMGIGSGLIYLPSVAVQAHHFRRHRALAIGIAITGKYSGISSTCANNLLLKQGSSVGGIVYPIMLNNLFHGSTGFAWGVRASAFLTLGILVLANLLMTDKPHRATPGTTVTKPSARDIYTDIPFMLTTVVGKKQKEGKMEQLTQEFQLTIQNGASIFGRTIPNVLADKYGCINVIMVLVFSSSIIVFGLFGIHSVAGVAIFAALYGFFAGGALSLFAPVMTSFVRHPNELGLRLGIAYVFTSLGYLTGPPIIGAL